jgi:hypothetical protein
VTEGTRPEGGFGPPSGAGDGDWLPPQPPGPPPGSPPPAAPPGWRVSPKATDLDPDAPSGPEPWADPGNSTAAPGLGFSVAACGLVFSAPGLAIFSIPIAIAGTVLSATAYRRLRSGETRKGRVEATVGLVVGVGAFLVALAVVIVAVAVD